METLLVILYLALGLLVLAAPVFSLVSFLRLRSLEKRLAETERRLARAESRIDSYRREPKEHAANQPTAGKTPAAEVPTSMPSSPGGWPAPAPTRSPAPEEPVPATPGAAASPTPVSNPALAQRPPKIQLSPRRRIDWEQWVGVRGAAVAGGILLALAGLLLFQHAYEQGWVTPRSRVLSGTLTGVGALVLSEVLRRRGFRFAPAGMAGGGVVVLYATTWASYRIFEFLPGAVALPLMALITLVCGFYSIRMGSQLVAILGLLGGFATPVLLALPEGNPLGLMGYILLLDIGLLGLGKRTKAPLLALLGILGTFAIMLLWILVYLESQDIPLALVSLGVFALLFSLAGLRNSEDERPKWYAAQAAALLGPFFFVAYFASLVDLGGALWPLACLAGLLAVAAAWIGNRQGANWLSGGAAVGTLSLAGIWMVQTGAQQDGLWEFAACSLVLALVFLIAERCFGLPKPNSEDPRPNAPAAPALLSIGFLFMLMLLSATGESSSPWPWLVASLGHAICLHIQGSRKGMGGLRLMGALLASISLGAHMLQASATPLELGVGPSLSAAWILLASLLFLLLGVVSAWREEANRSAWAWRSAGAFPLVMLAFLPRDGGLLGSSAWLVMALSLGLACLSSAPAMLRSCGPWSIVVGLMYVLKRTHWILYYDQSSSAGILHGWFWIEILGVAVLAGLPLLARKSLGASHSAWAASGLLLLFSLRGLDYLASVQFGLDAQWISPLAIGATALILGALSRQRLTLQQPARDTAARWLLGLGLVYVSLALARGLEHHIPILACTWAALGLALLWRWLPHPSLRIFVCGLTGFSSLTLGWQVLRGFGGASLFDNAPYLIWNWSSYASGIPALCALLCFRIIAPKEDGQSSAAESPSNLVARKWASTLLALDAIFFSFVWLNLQVLTYFETSTFLRFDLRSLPARDLSLSIAWILFALLLLAVGMAKSVSALRKISLAFLLLTLVKVFLHDLGDLEGLYRIGSLMGLAVSLLLVSMLYQRFVFPKPSVEGG